MPEEINPAQELTATQPGPVSQWLKGQGFDHEVLDNDHLGIENLGVEAAFLPLLATALKANGFDYLQCQAGYEQPCRTERDRSNGHNAKQYPDPHRCDFGRDSEPDQCRSASN